MNKLLDYAVIIPTHGRYDRVFTIDSLRKSGYTGDIYLLCDDEDKQLEQYKEKYGDKVIVFSKDEYIGKFDKMDNFGNKACVVYARNAMWDAAKKLGLKFFIVADDDYTALEYRITADGGYYAKKIKNADGVFAAYVNFLKTSGVDTVCFAQGGDYIGGKDNSKVKNGFKVSRKMMNLYFFSADKPIEFTAEANLPRRAGAGNNRLMLGAMGGMQGGGGGAQSLDSSYSRLNAGALGMNDLQRELLKIQMESLVETREAARDTSSILDILGRAVGI